MYHLEPLIFNTQRLIDEVEKSLLVESDLGRVITINGIEVTDNISKSLCESYLKIAKKELKTLKAKYAKFEKEKLAYTKKQDKIRESKRLASLNVKPKSALEIANDYFIKAGIKFQDGSWNPLYKTV